MPCTPWYKKNLRKLNYVTLISVLLIAQQLYETTWFLGSWRTLAVACMWQKPNKNNLPPPEIPETFKPHFCPPSVCASWMTSFSSEWQQQRRFVEPLLLLHRLHLPALCPPSPHSSRRCSRPSPRSLAWTWNGPKSKSCLGESGCLQFCMKSLINLFKNTCSLSPIKGVCKTMNGISTGQHKSLHS